MAISRSSPIWGIPYSPSPRVHRPETKAPLGALRANLRLRACEVKEKELGHTGPKRGRSATVFCSWPMRKPCDCTGKLLFIYFIYSQFKKTTFVSHNKRGKNASNNKAACSLA